MIINHNLSAMNAHRQMGINTGAASKSIEKLSSGQKINRAGDDAAGLAISEKMRSQIRGLDQGSTNAQDGVSLVQTAEGAMTETHAMLQRLKTLATQASNGTLQSADRKQIQTEVAQLKSEISRIASTTNFNGINLTGSAAGKVTFQVGGEKGNDISVQLSSAKANNLGTKNATGTGFAQMSYSNGVGTTTVNAEASLSNISLSSQGGAVAALKVIDDAINQVSTMRANLGAVQNRLEHTITATDNTSENLQAAESRIRDTDMAKEMMNYTKNNILTQAAQSMLAQANQQPNKVLNLLQG
ncbi:flagellin [Clostridium saccharoperbutylacetonicum]|uniref:Flagellin n=1 Tax=Clostridium saccharoperbutylacetonicum N1-4(HMT) TaxID=931276 RepID=M1MK87_9CLOT|nr:flagellin [Clostridium saccharoperbutylacetonicum]AGF58324.1 flagellin [Clostridium saccharoperbutylacetonicum N1-4(HMT)]NRT60899.1 flagellin [Clostridium saccharoperbutylacetonicum]NSB24212.1 flagellin [Clostridium saccharoperbutylacetonicum]NSB43590.1 flagellin [Clostridium saccharoperbutylacetonicum]